MSAHTPGPWSIVGDSVRHTDDGECVAFIQTHRGLCFDVVSPGRMEPDVPANARLIAAAPELLEALKGMLDFFAPADGQRVSIDAVMRAEFVLAKIEGAQ